MKSENLLMLADSERDADMLYAVGMFAPDPFLYLSVRGKPHIVLNDLEMGRARRCAQHCRIVSLRQVTERLRRNGVEAPDWSDVIGFVLRQKGIRKIVVPDHFPFALARKLRNRKIKLRVKEGDFFPNRQLKSAAEVKKISAALIMAEVGLSEAIQTLKNARIGKNRRLLFHNVPLTSEKLRAIIDTAVLQAGGLPRHTIVAGGRQACDPHECGTGQLRANEPIIIDIFPRSQKTGYYGDISRTVVKGRASEGVRRLFHAVARAQDLAFRKVKAGVGCAEAHIAIREFFDREGYPTRRRNGDMEGFFHSTGHGLGLELHEAPSIGPNSNDQLLAGQVVSIEPGLYYPELGGVRLEDVAHLSAHRTRNLTKFEKVLEV
ncbi:MAG: Xaa-Pro peptidase family protein [Verrucomicrobia bacterium]|nr:Xaa-Pro peptidase family protein [Verrucomicrobiota bacterium]